MKRTLCALLALATLSVGRCALADQTDDFHGLKDRIDTALLDIYGGDVPPQTCPSCSNSPPPCAPT